ncbi:MAG: NAD(P)H-binding protein [Pseudomonadota bacterium]|nr:NAD(P)H-binding protein [Burkholderiaceae bacterium]MDQ3444796.1 NAD(P)H-binding protein [Pseudomonadota bacterium]
MRVLVLGGAGFIGRHAVAALLARGHEVVVGSRHPERAARRLPLQAHACERRTVRLEQLLTADLWRPRVAAFDVVLNCVGILRQRGAETYDRVHHLAPAALADACALAGVRRLVHVSALGLDERVTSGFLTSKRRGETALRARAFDCVIVRPSLLDGADGYGARWFRRVARWPVHFVPASARGRVAPLDVDDLGVALAVLCEVDHPPSREIELGGSAQMTIREYLARLRVEQRGVGVRPALTLAIPHWLARIGSHVCDLLHVTPFSFGHLQLMQRDNVPRVNRLPELLRVTEITRGGNRQIDTRDCRSDA